MFNIELDAAKLTMFYGIYGKICARHLIYLRYNNTNNENHTNYLVPTSDEIYYEPRTPKAELII